MTKTALAADRSAPRVVTLKRRAQFLRIRKGARWATSAFVLEAKRRDDEAADARNERASASRSPSRSARRSSATASGEGSRPR
jgi:hypothetical protein